MTCPARSRMTQPTAGLGEATPMPRRASSSARCIQWASWADMVIPHSLKSTRRNDASPGLLTCSLTGLTSVCRIDTLYNVIRSFRHSGLEGFYRKGSKAGIQPSHVTKLRRQLTLLDAAVSPQDMDVPG